MESITTQERKDRIKKHANKTEELLYIKMLAESILRSADKGINSLNKFGYCAEKDYLNEKTRKILRLIQFV